METYHKIQTLFKRHLDGRYKGKMIRGQWTTPALEYLANSQWDFTEKVDGTNIRIWYRPSVAGPDGFGPLIEFAGRTDNAVLPTPLLEHLNETFTTELFHQAFPDVDVHGVLLFGEGYGPKIQNGGNYRDDQSFVLFDVKIGDFWLERHNVADIANKLGIDVVPSLGQGTLHDAIDIVESGLTWDAHGKMTNWGGGGIKGLKSQWGDFEAEGIVARPLTPLFDRKGDRIITKIKAVDFK